MNIDGPEIHSDLPTTLKLFFDPTITSIDADHRKNLRESLYHKLLDHRYSAERQNLLDLATRPTHKELLISLSHCPTGSAIAWVDRQFRVGTDVESAERLHSPLIERIAKADEIKACPAPQMIFGAKEATWKALSHNFKNKTLSHFVTQDWLLASNGWSSFKVAADGNIIDGVGFCQQFSGTYVSLFVSPSTFV